jgi:endonuclease/exonuclease/phosphatase family metal-dependent hydrolase
MHLSHFETPPGSTKLTGWRANVGAPIVLDPAPPTLASTPGATALLVLSWNVWVGRGRLTELVDRIRAGSFAALDARSGLPLVLLVQEGYRVDDSIPLRSNGLAARERMTRTQYREDIVDVARRLRLNLRFAPSMRNGGERSDRGNAILSSLPLDDARALELPLVLQRRVAVTASVVVAGRRVRLVSAHLDPRGPVGHKWLGAAGRALQIAHLLETVEDDVVVMGADLNLGRGRAERTWRLLGEAGFNSGIPPALPSWRHTYHAIPRLVLDYVLLRDRAGDVARATVHRLDENPRDRGVTVFGSDHHPLLARIDFGPGSPPEQS